VLKVSIYSPSKENLLTFLPSFPLLSSLILLSCASNKYSSNIIKLGTNLQTNPLHCLCNPLQADAILEPSDKSLTAKAASL